MDNIRVLVAHKSTLYKQSLVEALEKFKEFKVVGQARFFDELIRTAKDVKAKVVIAEEDIFPKTDINRIFIEFSLAPYTVILTNDPHRALKSNFKNRVVFFYTDGYLIDLYRTIKALVEEKTIAQPATFKQVLNYMRILEEQGIRSEELFLAFNKEELSMIIDIIRGKSFNEIIAQQKTNEEEIKQRIDKILKKMSEIVA